MIKKLRKKFFNKVCSWKIRTQLVLLIVTAGLGSIILFEILWMNKWNVCNYVSAIPVFKEQFQQEEFWKTVQEEALKYNVPSSENDEDSIEKLKPFLKQGDKYTGIYIYGLQDGNYLAGHYPPIFNNVAFRTFFDLGYQLTGGEGEEMYEFPMKFKNGYATVMIWFCHRVRFIYPYCIFSLTISIGTFFGIILHFLKKKMNSVAVVKDEILRMASGNLRDQVPKMGEDEIGIIAEELDHLRVVLQETILREKESRKANQDLITVMSHDLRTPLTILNGYLEVLARNRNPAMNQTYIERCLQKTKDIREMTDRMFEYALVFEEGNTPEIVKMPVDFLQKCIEENCDFIRLSGFQAEVALFDQKQYILGDPGMIKRIFHNLFSNILKYGDKQTAIVVKGRLCADVYAMTLSNAIRQDNSKVESNCIGLKSVEKMMQQLGGEIEVHEEKDRFTVNLIFSL